MISKSVNQYKTSLISCIRRVFFKSQAGNVLHHSYCVAPSFITEQIYCSLLAHSVRDGYSDVSARVADKLRNLLLFEVQIFIFRKTWNSITTKVADSKEHRGISCSSKTHGWSYSRNVQLRPGSQVHWHVRFDQAGDHDSRSWPYQTHCNKKFWQSARSDVFHGRQCGSTFWW